MMLAVAWKGCETVLGETNCVQLAKPLQTNKLKWSLKGHADFFLGQKMTINCMSNEIPIQIKLKLTFQIHLGFLIN